LKDTTVLAPRNPFANTDEVTTTFVVQAHAAAERIAGSYSALLRTYQQFDMDPDLRPIHCDRAVAAVQSLRAAVEQLGVILRRTEHLPSSIALQRYSVLSVVCFAEEQTDSTISMLTLFRPICRDHSFQVSQQRTAIMRRLDALLQIGDALPVRVLTLVEHIEPRATLRISLAS
jgi:hypothetical protein